MIAVIGNPELESDNLALKIGKRLEAAILKRPEDIENYDKLTIIDVVENLKEPKIIKISELNNHPKSTMHDFDLGFYLRLQKELNPDIKIKIIGIPQTGDIDIILRKIKYLIS